MKAHEPMKESISTILNKYLSKSEKEKEGKVGRDGDEEVERRRREVEGRSQQKVESDRERRWATSELMEV